MNKNDTENNFPIKFQLMPKRFMVWDETTKHFIKHGTRVIWTINNLAHFYTAKQTTRYKIVQSTNLYDKDGKEIFEGSIIEVDGNGIGILEYDLDTSKFKIFHYGDWEKNRGTTYQNDIKVVGHILSNPQLLEGK